MNSIKVTQDHKDLAAKAMVQLTIAGRQDTPEYRLMERIVSGSQRTLSTTAEVAVRLHSR